MNFDRNYSSPSKLRMADDTTTTGALLKVLYDHGWEPHEVKEVPSALCLSFVYQNGLHVYAVANTDNGGIQKGDIIVNVGQHVVVGLKDEAVQHVKHLRGVVTIMRHQTEVQGLWVHRLAREAMTKLRQRDTS